MTISTPENPLILYIKLKNAQFFNSSIFLHQD